MAESSWRPITGLGVRVYLDENIDLQVAEALQARGYDATHAFTEGNRRFPDEDHLLYAAAQGRALVTHNFADYARLHLNFIQRGERHAGIILVPVRPISELIPRLGRHLDTVSPAQQHGNLLWA
ncbi:MAG TPA: DUF5615 family PIN-like protein [Dehalococcoidia bacterium]|nr:DUF5615 family PIN-like protein [Dehalococcoidia bacterium]